MARNVAWGIDIGESAIKVVQMRKTGDSVVLQQHRTISCAAHADEAQGGDREYRVRNALLALQEETDIKGTVVVSISGQDVFPRFLPLPPVEPKRIPEVVRYEARTSMPFPIEEVIWDYQPLDEHPEPGEEIEVALFAIKRATVYGFLANLRLAHLTPDILEIGPLALYNMLVYDRDIDTGTVVIDVGAGNTDLLIIDGERFWTRNVSISGNDISRALQEKYQISFEEAEDLKKKAADSKQADKLFGVMRPIVDDLIGEIQRSIGYYKAQTQTVRIERVLLLGNAFKLKHLVEYFRENLDYEVGIIGGLQRIRVAGTDPNAFAAEVPNYAVAIGLALQGLGLARVNIDMLPSDVVRQRVLRQKVPFVAAAVGLLALPILIGFTSASRDISRFGREIKPIETAISEYVKKKKDEDQARDLSPMASQLKEIAGIGERRADWPQYMDQLNLALSRVPRGRFLVRRISHLVEGAAPGGRGRFGRRRARAAAKAGDDKKEKQEGVVELLLELESNEPFSASDYDAIKSYFIDVDPSTKKDLPYKDRPHIRKVSFGEVREERGRAAVVAARGGVMIRDKDVMVSVLSVTVTFSVEPLKESQSTGASTGASKAAAKK